MQDPNNPSREELVQWFNSPDIQENVLAYARECSRERGLDITFEGVYRQGFLERPDLVNLDPFVIAQNSAERALNNQGILRGTIFEFMKSARILDGRISPVHISFAKQYEPSSIPGYRVNPNPIFYEGKANADQVYRGRWRFSSDVGDLARRGTFELIAIEDTNQNPRISPENANQDHKT